MSKIYYKVHMTCVLHIARISNVNAIINVDRNKRGRERAPNYFARNFSILEGGFDSTLKDLKNKKDKANSGARL